MTVAELMTELSKMPADLKVLSLGYEGGFDEVVQVQAKTVTANEKNEQWWDGKFEVSPQGESAVVLLLDRG